MGPFACRKLLQIVKNVAHIVSIELHAACQAYEFTVDESGAIVKTTPALESVYNKVRTVAKTIKRDRYFQPEIESIKKFVMNTRLV